MEPPRPGGEKMRETSAPAQLLIVDDNINALRALHYVLEREGFGVDCAASGSVALDFLRKSTYDVVVSDVMMPGMNGMELLEHIRGNYPELPVLMLSAHGTIERAVEAVRCGAFDFVQKPWKQAEICLKVRRALERSQPEPKATETTEPV